MIIYYLPELTKHPKLRRLSSTFVHKCHRDKFSKTFKSPYLEHIYIQRSHLISPHLHLLSSPRAACFSSLWQSKPTENNTTAVNPHAQRKHRAVFSTRKKPTQTHAENPSIPQGRRWCHIKMQRKEQRGWSRQTKEWHSYLLCWEVSGRDVSRTAGSLSVVTFNRSHTHVTIHTHTHTHW